MTLSDKEFACAVANTMTFATLEKRLEYVEKRCGEKISQAAYYRILGTIEAKTIERMQNIAKRYEALHMEKYDELTNIKAEMWRQYYKDEASPAQKSIILLRITDVLQLMRQLEEITKDTLEDHMKAELRKPEEPIVIPGSHG